MTDTERKNRIRQLRAELKELQAVPRSDWHSGFEALLRIDTHKYGEHVRIKTEEVLGEEPPRADYLILIEDEEITFDKEIFKIFRKYNVIEYKNPHDSLNERVIRKICGYANFYIGTAEHQGEILPDQVTVSIFRAVKNPELFKTMEEERTLVKSDTPGIYHVVGLSDLPFQIVITSELAGEEYAAYRALTENATERDIERVIDAGEKTTDYAMREHYRILLGLIAVKNPEVFSEIRRDNGMQDYLMEIMKDEVEAKVNEKVNEKVIEKVIEKERETKLIDIRNLMKNLQFTMEQAMQALEIPQDMWSTYTNMIQKQ